MSISFLPKPDAATGSSAERSLRLLAVLADHGTPMTLAELVHALNLPKGTVHRICTQLQECGFVARDVDENAFVVGAALRKLALDTLNHGTVRGVRHEVLTALVSEVGETCNFTTLDGANVLYLDRVEAPWPWRLTLDVGVHVPIHCTASGKLFLSAMEPKARRTLLEALKLQAMTDHTLVSIDALNRECETIAKQGYSFDREEFVTGLIAMAVPVRDTKGTVRATIAVHAPTTRVTIDDLVARLPALRAAADRMATLL